MDDIYDFCTKFSERLDEVNYLHIILVVCLVSRNNVHILARWRI